MGRSKPLLPWDGRTVIETVVSRLVAARPAEIAVVTGYQGDQVARALRNLPVQIVHNPDYEQGEMLSSLQTGLRALPGPMAACLVVMGDQPFIDGRVIGQVLTAYAEGQGTIVAPAYRGQRGHRSCSTGSSGRTCWRWRAARPRCDPPLPGSPGDRRGRHGQHRARYRHTGAVPLRVVQGGGLPACPARLRREV